MEVDTRISDYDAFNVHNESSNPSSVTYTNLENSPYSNPPDSNNPISNLAADVLLQQIQSSLKQANNEASSSSSSSNASTSEPNSPAGPLLPPCRICEEKASGFHYGANTCEACKGFFRRSLVRKEEYKCCGSVVGECEIGVGKRNACGYCRYHKCLAAGMSKTAIKTGRYTHKKKTQDIREVKRLQHQHKLKKEGKIVIEIETKEEELEKIIKHITDVHMQQTPHTPEFFEKLPQKEKEFLEQRELQQKMFGTMRPLPREEYMKIYQSTGIDIDGRREMIKHMIPCIEKAIKRFIAFAKALPGFKDLPIDDQIALIKASRLETWLISSHQAFNRDFMLFTDVCGYTLDMTELCKVHQEDHLESIFLVASKMQRLGLTTEEACVLKGVCILQSDRACLQNPDIVEHCQSILLTALEYLVHKNHPRERHYIPRVIALLTEMRTLTELQRRWEENINMDWSAEFTFPPLLYEIASTSAYEQWLVLQNDSFNPERKLYTSKICGETLHMVEDLGRMHSLEYIDHLVRAVTLIGALKLTLEEKCVLCSLNVLSTDGRKEAFQILHHQAFNVEKEIVTLGGKTIHLDRIVDTMYSKELIELKMRIVVRMQKLGLSYQESLLLASVAILSPASRVEAFHIWHYRAFNLELGVATFPSGRTVDLDMLEGYLFTKDLMTSKKAIVWNLQNLELIYEEVVLLGAIAILASDRCVLKEPQKVEEAQWTLLEALKLLLKKNHPDEQHLLAKCILVLTELRTVSALHAKEEEKFTMDWSDKIEFPPLFYEIWST